MSPFHNTEVRTLANGSRWVETGEETRERQERARKQMEQAWGLSLQPYPYKCPVDWWAERDGELVATVELKTRGHSSTKYPTVFLSVQKWAFLQRFALGLGVPSLFVVEFRDAMLWQDVLSIDATRHTIGGFARPRKVNDREPIILVDIAGMRPLRVTPCTDAGAAGGKAGAARQ